MKHGFGKSLLLIGAAALLSTTTFASGQVRTNQMQLAPNAGGNGPVISNGVGSPDLVIQGGVFICGGNGYCPPPNSHLPGTGFCGYWVNGGQTVNLVIRNNGQALAGPSQVRIEYLYSGSGLQTIANVPALAPNQAHSVFFDVPNGAWAPGSHSSFHFRLRADSGNTVSESNERNNLATSHCVGPAS